MTHHFPEDDKNDKKTETISATPVVLLETYEIVTQEGERQFGLSLGLGSDVMNTTWSRRDVVKLRDELNKLYPAWKDNTQE